MAAHANAIPATGDTINARAWVNFDGEMPMT
jgi:hypothetical protein